MLDFMFQECVKPKIDRATASLRILRFESVLQAQTDIFQHRVNQLDFRDMFRRATESSFSRNSKGQSTQIEQKSRHIKKRSFCPKLAQTSGKYITMPSDSSTTMLPIGWG
jgi:hypothetical protein